MLSIWLLKKEEKTKGLINKELGLQRDRQNLISNLMEIITKLLLFLFVHPILR